MIHVELNSAGRHLLQNYGEVYLARDAQQQRSQKAGCRVQLRDVAREVHSWNIKAFVYLRNICALLCSKRICGSHPGKRAPPGSPLYIY